MASRPRSNTFWPRAVQPGENENPDGVTEIIRYLEGVSPVTIRVVSF
ncbi:hypothetical protein C5167_027284, partial [Papaver somniferum]